MSIDDDIALFEDVPVLAVLGEQALRILAIGSETQEIASGSVLFYADDPANAGFVVQEGRFRLMAGGIDESDDDLIVGPGTLIGERALLVDGRRPATAVALEEAVVIRIPRTLFAKVLDGFPDGASQLRERMAQRVERLASDLGRVQRLLGDV